MKTEGFLYSVVGWLSNTAFYYGVVGKGTLVGHYHRFLFVLVVIVMMLV
jgi:hypothetical protein